MKKIISSIISSRKNTVVAFVLFALIAPLQVRAEADVCEGNGYKLEIGSDFKVQRKDAEICSYRSGEDAVILLKDWPGLSKVAIENFIDNGNYPEGIVMPKRGELRQISTAGGTGYLAKVSGTIGNKAVEGVAGGFVGEKGQGVAVLIASVADKWGDFEKQADAVIESIEFTEFEQRMDARVWHGMLSGTGLSHKEFSEQGDTQEDYFFCSDGYFYSTSKQSRHASGDGNTMFGFSNSRDSGEWELKTVQGGTQLVLYYNNGRESRANIEDRNGETWVDGTRYYMIENHRCR
jgi:hypothetical protein